MHQNSAEGHHMGNFPPTNFLSFFGPLILVWIGGAPLLVLASIALCTCECDGTTKIPPSQIFMCIIT